MSCVITQWIRWHPKGHLILAGSEDSTVWMWNADKMAYLNMFSGHGNSVTCGDFTPDGTDLVSLLLSATKGVFFYHYQHYGPPLCLGKTICTGSDDATLRIWNPKSGENIHVVKGILQPLLNLVC